MIGSRKDLKEGLIGNSLAVQWLGLPASTAGGTGLIPGWGTKIPCATWQGQKKKKKIKKKKCSLMTFLFYVINHVL